VSDVGGATRVGAVLGWPVAHSASPALHNAAFRALGIDAVFVALPVAPADLPAAVRGLRALGMLGASVTVPHKQAIVALCDRLDPSAERVGAVNCLVLDGGVTGHNTDAGGFTDALRGELGREPAGARAVLLGAGGAARAVAVALTGSGAAVQVIARSAATWCAARPWTAESLRELLPACDLLVDCTPVGLAREQAGAMPVDVPIDLLPAAAAVCALSYGAPGSALLARARARGLAAMDGAAMLVHQGARAFTLWTGRPAPLEVMHAAMAARLDALT
jgi:shikimate dehydrogenase